MNPILPAVTSALESAQTKPEDAGTVALALRYAELLDEASVSQQYVEAIRLVGNTLDTSNPLVLKAWDRISAALSEHTTASDIGPKLLATLAALGATVAARKDVKGGGDVVNIGANPLQALRDAARQRNAAAIPGATA